MKNPISDEPEEPLNFNYENCIVTTHDDSDSQSELSNISLHLDDDFKNEQDSNFNTSKLNNLDGFKDEQETQSNTSIIHRCNEFSLHLDDSVKNGQITELNSNEVNHDDSSMDITCDQLADFDLNAEDAFVFLLGIMSRMQKYLTNPEGPDKTWLLDQIFLLKTALIKSRHLFKIHEVLDINGITYISNCDGKKPKSVKKTEKIKKAKKQLVNNCAAQPKLNNHSLVEAPDLHLKAGSSKTTNVDQISVQNNSKMINSDISNLNRRRSQRIQNISQVKKIPCVDRLAYITTKLNSYKSSQSSPKKSDATSKHESRLLVKNIFSKSINGQDRAKTKKAANSTKRANTEETRSKIKKTIRRKVQSLGMNAINANVLNVTLDKVPTQSNKSQVKKRRAASLDGVASKKARNVDLDEAGPSQPDTSVLRGGKRTLYKEDSWLQTLGSFLQTTPPYT